MRIVFFNRSFYPDTTATGQLLTELCETLIQEYGCSVSVVAGLPLIPGGDNGSPTTKWGIFRREQHRGIEILRAQGTRFSKRRFFGRFSNYVTYFASACYAGLRIPRPDVVVALTDPPIIGLAAYLASRRFGARFVMSYRDIFPEVARLLEDFQSETVNRILQAVNCFLVRKADRVVALGESMRQKLVEGKGADVGRTSVIPDWADCSEIVPGPKRNPFSVVHGLDDKFVVMHSGNIGLSQGLEALVDAACCLGAAPEVQWVFVGDGAKRPVLERRVRSQGLGNVRFLPYQPKENLKDSFGSADVFVVSLKRGLAGYIVPSKLYGILAAGRPYVAAVEEECEVANITKKYDCGLIAEPENPQDLAAKILTLYRDPVLARRLGENARKAALHFDRPLWVRAYYDLFCEISGVKPRSSVRSPVSSRGQWNGGCQIKRLFDVTLAGVGLIVSSPLWVLFSIAIKLDDAGPVFHGQERVGRDGRRFKSWKFRSMVPDSEKRFGPLQAKEDDHRVTRVGRVLRATALDELPQLWNILKGDMSFVGPRALLPGEIEIRDLENGRAKVISLEQIPGCRERHRIRPGLTGLAQVYASRDIPRRYKFKYDLLYIRRQSFWLDLKLIALSFWITFRAKWESREKKF